MTKEADPCDLCEYSYKEDGESIWRCNATEKEKREEECPFVPSDVIH